MSVSLNEEAHHRRSTMLLLLVLIMTALVVVGTVALSEQAVAVMPGSDYRS